MSFTLDEGTGTLFKNQKESERQPDYKGKVMLEGEEKSIALWLRESKKGTKYFFCKISEFKPMPKEAKELSSQDDFDDSIPF